jgi:ribosomal protein S17E
LDQVKENETYKVAQELLEKYDPEYRQKQRNKQQTSRQTEGTGKHNNELPSLHISPFHLKQL